MIKNLCLRNGEMVKAGWIAPPNISYGGRDFITDEAFEDVKNSGINLLYMFFEPDKYPQDADRFMSLADKYDIYVFVPDGRLMEKDFDLDAFLTSYRNLKKYKCFLGYNICDEPGRNKFELIAENCRRIRPHIDVLLYVNHMPMYATTAQLFGGWWTPDLPETKSLEYRNFLEDFYNLADVDIVSYDFYPFRHEKGICDPRYFEQLCIARDISEKVKKPLWNFTQVTSWNRDHVRNMTYSELEWLNNTSIACGVSGIQYFCYWTPLDGVESFLSAMITRDGHKTRHYYFAKRINEKLDFIASYILNADFKGTIAYGDTLCGFPHEKNLWTYGNIKMITSDGVMIGCFDYKGNNMYYVVNTSILESRANQLGFKKPVTADVIDGKVKTEFKGDKLNIVIAPGEAVLIIEK